MMVATAPPPPEHVSDRVRKLLDGAGPESQLESAMVALIDIWGHTEAMTIYAKTIQKAFHRRRPPEAWIMPDGLTRR